MSNDKCAPSARCESPTAMGGACGRCAACKDNWAAKERSPSPKTHGRNAAAERVTKFFMREIGKVPVTGLCTFQVDGAMFFDALVSLVEEERSAGIEAGAALADRHMGHPPGECEARRKLGVARGALAEIDGLIGDPSITSIEALDQIKDEARTALDASAMPQVECTANVSPAPAGLARAAKAIEWLIAVVEHEVKPPESCGACGTPNAQCDGSCADAYYHAHGMQEARAALTYLRMADGLSHANVREIIRRFRLASAAPYLTDDARQTWGDAADVLEAWIR